MDFLRNLSFDESVCETFSSLSFKLSESSFWNLYKSSSNTVNSKQEIRSSTSKEKPKIIFPKTSALRESAFSKISDLVTTKSNDYQKRKIPKFMLCLNEYFRINKFIDHNHNHIDMIMSSKLCSKHHPHVNIVSFQTRSQCRASKSYAKTKSITDSHIKLSGFRFDFLKIPTLVSGKKHFDQYLIQTSDEIRETHRSQQCKSDKANVQKSTVNLKKNLYDHLFDEAVMKAELKNVCKFQSICFTPKLLPLVVETSHFLNQ
ncbi:unnamed protein product [Trichobilharzia regenti]|nr:unnamed protein product [Trichobilharzia regenti]